MFRTKIAGLTAIGLLAMGVSSPALAVPIINVTWDFQDVASSPTTERDYFFEIGFADCVSCNSTLLFFDVIFAFDDIVDFVGIVTDDDWVSSGWSDPEVGNDPYTGDPEIFDGVAFIDHAGLGIMASPLVEDIFKLTIRVNYAVDSFPFPLFDPFLDFVFDDYSVATVFMSEGSLENTLTFDVPEPGTLVLFGLGLLGMGAARRRKI